jgi:hypothetical protein
MAREEGKAQGVLFSGFLSLNENVSEWKLFSAMVQPQWGTTVSLSPVQI